ncbi:MAG: hypothetical protein JW720_11070 [Sedimentisphaerales bacterium]|nr:hypothetical protein [Sedimentisphaerales bacterium]
MNTDTMDKWFQAIFTSMVLISIIIFFWVPLFFVLAPGAPYRMMLGGFWTLIVVVSSLIYSIILLFISTKDIVLKILAIVSVLTPIALLLSIILLLAAMGHVPAP